MHSETDFHSAHEVSNFIREDISQYENTLVVFDLDSTLYSVQPRTQKILHDFLQQEEIQQKHPELTSKLERLKIEDHDWGILTALKRSQIAAPLSFFEQLREFWKLHFFSNHYLQYDHIYEKADEYVNALHQSGAKIAYLTGRNQINMKEGTQKSLKKHNFPGEDLLMKPSKELDDVGFKQFELEQLCKTHARVWFFENEPVILNSVQKQQPHIQLVWIDSTHSGRQEIGPVNYKIKPNYSQP